MPGELQDQPGKDVELYWNYVAQQVFMRLDDKCYFLTAGVHDTLHGKLVISGFNFRQHDIISVFYDARQERIFAGSWSRGLYVFTRKQFHPLTSTGNISNIFYAQAPYGDNGIVTPQGMVFDEAGQ